MSDKMHAKYGSLIVPRGFWWRDVPRPPCHGCKRRVPLPYYDVGRNEIICTRCRNERLAQPHTNAKEPQPTPAAGKAESPA